MIYDPGLSLAMRVVVTVQQFWIGAHISHHWLTNEADICMHDNTHSFDDKDPRPTCMNQVAPLGETLTATHDCIH